MALPATISSSVHDSRRRQFGWLSLVPGRLACSLFADHVLELNQHQPRPRAREIDMDRVAQLGRIDRLAVEEKFAEALARQQPFADQRLEQQVTVAAALGGLGVAAASSG